jgi:transposase-like protein
VFSAIKPGQPPATVISNVTNSVLEEVQAWQAWPLDPVYPIIHCDCLFVKSRQDGSIRNKAVYLALAINMDGEKELLGMWLAETQDGGRCAEGDIQRTDHGCRPGHTGTIYPAVE